MPVFPSFSALRAFMTIQVEKLRDAAWWTVIRVPSPLHVAIMSRTPSALAAVIALMTLATFLLFRPSGLIGLIEAGLAWWGSLVLAATAVRAFLLERRVLSLEEKLRASDLALNTRINAEELSLLEKTQAATTRSSAA